MSTNTLIGQAECAKWGKSTQVGYFLMQLEIWGKRLVLQKSGIHVAAFGRRWSQSVDNQVLEWAIYLSIFWNVLAKADGSRVLNSLCQLVQ